MIHPLRSIRRLAGMGSVAWLLLGPALCLLGQSPNPSANMKDAIRQPWVRSNERFIRGVWQISGEIPVSGPDALGQDPFAGQGGEGSLDPFNRPEVDGDEGTRLRWRAVTSWGDTVDLSDGPGLKRDLVAYAATRIHREEPGRALLCLGSDEGMRVWVNGTLVHEAPGPRPLTFDEDLVEVDLAAGLNTLLVKVEQRTGPWHFAARLLESGALPSRVQEIGPSFTVEAPLTLVIRTDIERRQGSGAEVTVEAVAAGGRVIDRAAAARGRVVRFDAADWPEGAYELRFTTRKADGLGIATHLAWFKGDAIEAARDLVAAGKAADAGTPAGQTVRMLADMVLDRLGDEGLAVTGNPWWAIHSPLMEFAELKLERNGEVTARVRPGGFVRLAWRDDVDGSPQFARAYLPVDYDPARKTPLVLRLHGFNPANPDYIRWWAVDSRHALADAAYGKGEGLIYLEPHGRGNTEYLGIGDADVLRAIAEAKARFNVDEDRVYLCGDSMGGWGTWNVGTRHPDLFAALAPIYGGVDYRSVLSEAQLAALNPVGRFLHERESSLAQAEGLFNLPVLVLHGDKDASVPVEWSRDLVRRLQTWGYDVRYVEFPGYGHEDLSCWPLIFNWFLEHRREAQPRRVRIRSAELANASAYWAAVDQFDRPDRFMRIDAEIVDAQTIRLDSTNVLEVTLSPGPTLIDLERPVTVVWNGVSRDVAPENGRIRMGSGDRAAAPIAKSPVIAGPIGDIINRPFAIVSGTVSIDPAMNEACREMTDALVAAWQDWQRHPPRVFPDTGLTDADAAGYSLILIGGPEANSVTRKLADRLPLEVSAEVISVGGRTFEVRDGRVEMIRPNPLNPQHQVLVVAATSPTGLRRGPIRFDQSSPFDFAIYDGHAPAIGQAVRWTDLLVAGGWFDRNWGMDESLVHRGDAGARSKAMVLRGPLPAEVLERYVGRYRIAADSFGRLVRSGSRLTATVDGYPPAELIPAGDHRFYIVDGPVVVTFQTDAAGAVIGFATEGGEPDFSGQRVE